MVALRRPLTFSLTAAGLGPVWYAGLWVLPWTRSLVSEPHLYVFNLGPAGMVAAFSLTTLLVALLLRRRIASSRETLFLPALIGLAAGSVSFLWVCSVLALPGDVRRFGFEALSPGPLLEDWVMSLVGLFLAAPILGLYVAMIGSVSTIPLSLLTVLLLRRASGGLRPRQAAAAAG